MPRPGILNLACVSPCNKMFFSSAFNSTRGGRTRSQLNEEKKRKKGGGGLVGRVIFGSV